MEDDSEEFDFLPGGILGSPTIREGSSTPVIADHGDISLLVTATQLPNYKPGPCCSVVMPNASMADPAAVL